MFPSSLSSRRLNNIDYAHLSFDLSSHWLNSYAQKAFLDLYTYVTSDLIGSGSCASFYRCCSLTQPHEDLIVKVAAYTHENQKSLQNEFDLLQKIDYERVPKSLAIYFEHDKCYIVMRRIIGQTLDNFLKSQTIHISEVKYLLVQLLDTCEYLHELGICHRDLKPDNIIVD